MKLGNINLEWLGHSGFLLGDGKAIYIDPYNIKAGEKADIILITHGHYDHCSLEDMEKIIKPGTTIIVPPDCQSKITKLKNVQIQIAEPGEQFDFGIKILAFPAYNINKEFHPKAENWVGYIIRIDSLVIYHAGDTDLIPEMEKLGKVDIALLPIGGKFTMNAEQAVKAASIIKPKLAVPMHYGSIVGNEQDAERFVEGCEEEGIKAEILERV